MSRNLIKTLAVKLERSLSILKTSANQTTSFMMWWHIVFLI